MREAADATSNETVTKGYMHTANEHDRAEMRSAAKGRGARESDVAVIALSALAAAPVLPEGNSFLARSVAIVACATIFALVLFPAFGLYRAPPERSAQRIAIRACIAWALAQSGAALVMCALYGPSFVPAAWYLLWSVASGASLAASRLVAHSALGRAAGIDEPARQFALFDGKPHDEPRAQRNECRHRDATV
ncbi:hypothetical protein [Burkholderia stagnalis]|uniref:hypothetical protein n=1 Tax=Burkholderia stagnalis TaxID=1503054 RepID=UPI0021AB8194|nr:hypothetical protein [Burkholderia stagnalis]